MKQPASPTREVEDGDAEGTVRVTDDIFAETSGPAFDVNFPF